MADGGAWTPRNEPEPDPTAELLDILDDAMAALANNYRLLTISVLINIGLGIALIAALAWGSST